jgi:hypothetical protein
MSIGMSFFMAGGTTGAAPATGSGHYSLESVAHWLGGLWHHSLVMLDIRACVHDDRIQSS